MSARASRSIVERSRSMLEEAKLSKKYSAEAVNTSVYLKNRCSTRAVKGKMPEEAWFSRKVAKQKRRKFDSKTKKELLFVGYCETTKGNQSSYRSCKAWLT